LALTPLGCALSRGTVAALETKFGVPEAQRMGVAPAMPVESAPQFQTTTFRSDGRIEGKIVTMSSEERDRVRERIPRLVARVLELQAKESSR